MAKHSRRLSLLAPIFFFTLFAKAQETYVIEGWKYIPQDEKLKTQVDELKRTAQNYEVANLVSKVLADAKSDSLIKAEAKLFLAQALWDIDLKVLAFEYYKELIKDVPGTFIAQQALVEIEKAIPIIPTYSKDIKSILNRGAFKDVPEGVDSMIQYYVALDNFEKKEFKWAFSGVKKIKSESYWGQNIAYFNALDSVKEGDLATAEQSLTSLIENTKTHQMIRQKAYLQRARLYVEMKQFSKAEDDYLKYDSHGRETGRILYERALVGFFQKNYAFSLGLLESLKSENFKTAFSPEYVLLEMMIYRELCHYPTVKRIASEFEKKFNFLINYFKTGQEISKSQVVKKIIFQNAKFRDSADLINRFRVESRDVKNKHHLLDSQVQKLISKDLEKYERLYTEAIEKDIDPYLKATAEYFINKSEEIRLLEYVSGLDEFRIKNLFESRDYKSEKSENARNYSVLYWPVEKEYWWDEFKSYQVLLSDRCNGVATKKEVSK